jgi:hypothetical protein
VVDKAKRSHKGQIGATPHNIMTLDITTQSITFFSQCHIFQNYSVIMLKVIMPSTFKMGVMLVVLMLSGIILSVVILSGIAHYVTELNLCWGSPGKKKDFC